MSAPVRELAPAKINLALAVTGRRADGYHFLDTVVVFAELGDTLSAEPDDGFRVKVSGPFSAALSHEADNLALRAARLLAAHAPVAQRRGLGTRLRLVKTLPVAAGLGGGSADAAAALRALNRLWGLGLSAERLARIGARLGADVAMCVHSRGLRARGIGERIEPVAVPALSMALVNPNVTLATGDVFAASSGCHSPGLGELPRLADVHAVAEWMRGSGNDLQAPACALRPEIGEALAALDACPGCLVTRMSGSGATCFALFADAQAAKQAAHDLAVAHPGWWVAATTAR